MYLSVGLEPEEVMRLYEIQRSMHMADSKKAVVKTVEIMYSLLTNPKLAQIKDQIFPVGSTEMVMQKLIDDAYNFLREEGRIKE